MFRGTLLEDAKRIGRIVGAASALITSYSVYVRNAIAEPSHDMLHNMLADDLMRQLQNVVPDMLIKFDNIEALAHIIIFLTEGYVPDTKN